GQMMPLDAQRVQSLFLAAVEAGTPAARAVLLEQQCGTDAELRQRVEALLRAHDESDSFLDQPDSDLLTTTEESPIATGRPSITEGPGMAIGPYKLMELIGEGGWKRGASAWRRRRTKPGRQLSRRCNTGSATPTSPACAGRRPCPSCPCRNGTTGRSCGR